MSITVQEVIEQIKAPIGELTETVDRLIIGSSKQMVSGIAVTFIPTVSVLKRTVELGANLVIAHEGVFYHHSKPELFRETQNYQRKLKFIKAHDLAIFRCHDYIHKYKPDWITSGLIHILNWEPYVVQHLPAASIVKLPEMTLHEISIHVKSQLKLDHVRFMGDLKMRCNNLGIFVGYRGGGENVIPLLEKFDLDLVIYGEGPEWETPEFIRDAIQFGRNKALLVIGHLESEQPGMRMLAEHLQEKFPEIPVHFIPERGCFRIV